ncbi:hypothetical protein [Dickeya oryzae]
MEKRKNSGGNVYTENNDSIHVYKYDSYVFYTNERQIWDYVNSFVEFNRFTK